jgi:hypothetical protein
MNSRHPPERRPDHERIDLDDPDQVRDWTRSLGISAEELARIVASSGNTADNVKEHLLLRR